jgi:hypothetical protein
MIEFEDVAGPTPSAPPDDGYSPQLRTALVLTGTGTAGAYHAGVLRALHESGVKIDIVAGRGIGAVGALFAAVDGSQRLWDEKGFWRAHTVESFYSWRASLRVFAWALGVAAAAFVLPLLLIAAGLAVFPVDFLLRLAGLGGAASLVDGYLRLTQGAFAAERLPTWVPRVVTLAVIVAGVVAAVSLWTRSRASRRGAPWWRVVGSPLSSAAVHAHCWRVMWDLVRGAAPLKQPAPRDLARRYVELLAENIGQPGFRELLLTVHDLDARRDLVFAVVAESRRAALVKGNEERRSEVFDLGGLARDHLVDVLCGALSVPLATEPHPVQFAAESYWRGETHRVCDRPAALARVLEELGTLGAEQVIIVSSAAESPGPHALVRRRLDARGRLGEYLQSSDVASVRDASHSTAGIRRLFVIRPGHNPIGPFDFAGSYDDRSDRRQPLAELIRNGYEDAYRQFIEPVVGASGEGVAQGAAS